MDNTLGSLISAKRKEKQLTQSGLAEKFGISDKAVSKWERGLSRPDEKFMPELVELLGLPPEFLPQKKSAVKPRLLRQVLCYEFLRILAVGTLIASSVCLSTGSLKVEPAVILGCASAALLGFVTIIKHR